MTELVSIGIPAYNGAQYIRETIESALAQTYENIEVVVVDDGSSDRTVEIVKSFDDPRLRLELNPQNLGPSASWNRLLDLANGRYLKVLCHDDLIYPTCIEKQIAGFADPEVVLVASNRDLVNEAGGVVTSIVRARKDIKIEGELQFLRSVRRGTNLLGEPHAVLFDMDVIRKNQIRFGDDFFVIDIDFYAKLQRHGDVYLLAETLSAFRVSKDSASFKLAKEQVALFRKFVQQLRRTGDYKITALDYYSFIVCVEIRNVMKAVFYRLFVNA
jgi:glycosyltransferase involved in cell wall biosynthesis